MCCNKFICVEIVIEFSFMEKQNIYIHTPGDDQSQQHYPLHSQNLHQRPPSEHIYFSIESDYNSTNGGNEFLNSSGTSGTSTIGQSNMAVGHQQQNSFHRPSIAAQQWRLTSTHKNSSSSPQPHMV